MVIKRAANINSGLLSLLDIKIGIVELAKIPEKIEDRKTAKLDMNKYKFTSEELNISNKFMFINKISR